MKLIIDMNLSPRWVEFFTKSNITAVHWSTIGRINAPDAEIMEYAATNNYIVLTHDLDFSAILAALKTEKPSVVQIRAENVNPTAIGTQILMALHQMSSELEEGALLTIDTDSTRLRLLPLKK
jgi:predicted nuclease of predicted toxin-antitoxin system